MVNRFTMKWLILESTIPSDLATIKKCCKKDITDEKFSPSNEFVRTAYDYLNKTIFKNRLPHSLPVRCKTDFRGDYAAYAQFKLDFVKGKVESKNITVNSAWMMTIH